MKLRKVRLRAGNELPFNEPELSSKHYDLELVPSNVGGLLRITQKAPGVEPYYLPLGNVSGFNLEPEQAEKSGHSKPRP